MVLHLKIDQEPLERDVNALEMRQTRIETNGFGTYALYLRGRFIWWEAREPVDGRRRPPNQA